MSEGGAEDPTGLLSQSLPKKQEKKYSTDRALQPSGACHPWKVRAVASVNIHRRLHERRNSVPVNKCGGI